MRYIIGVDLGGTNLRAALADERGNIHHEFRIPTDAGEGPSAVIDKLVSSIQMMQERLPADATLAGVGLGSPGPLNPFEGIIYTLPNLPGWHDVPLRAILAERTGLSVELGNDANAAALGEWYFGAGKGVRNLVYVTVSTGIGGGVIVDGHLMLAHNGAAAEVGHHIIDYRTRASWEDLAAGPGLARAAAQAMAADPHTALHRLTTPAEVHAGHVAQCAAEGDALCLQLMDREGELIGVGLLNLLTLYSPALVLLGGGVIFNNPALIERAQTVVQEHAMAVYRNIPIRMAALGEQVGLLGAVAMFLHMRDERVRGAFAQ